MEIIYRNFISLLSAGAFSTKADIEPMSRFKWKQMLTLSATYNVYDYVAAGITELSMQEGNLIPKDIIEDVYAHQPAPTVNQSQENYVFSANKTDTKKFANALLNHKLKKIVYNEIHSIDTSTSTLTLLYMIIDNVNGVISDCIDYRQIISLGLYLRRNGDKIDFVKTDLWLNALGIKRPAKLVGSYLVSLFGFTESEVPFISKPANNAVDMALKPLRHTVVKASKEPDPRDYESKMTQRMHTPDTRSLVRLPYFPSEIICKFVSGVGKSLSNIEE